ncbi:hypothetical protein Tco_1415055, partial [Tanacetum coccineum]
VYEGGGELWRMDGDGDGWTKVKDFPPAANHPWTYDHEKIDIEALALNFNCGQPRRKYDKSMEYLILKKI